MKVVAVIWFVDKGSLSWSWTRSLLGAYTLGQGVRPVSYFFIFIIIIVVDVVVNIIIIITTIIINVHVIAL